jgi:muramoyltetrapeptide carboxypeptidase
MIPAKLQKGDEVRVISPSTSLSVLSEEQRKYACEKLQQLGFHVTFSKHAEEMDEFLSSSIESRIEDLHEAFLNPDVKGILTTLGGFNVNQLLKYIDYDIIKQNPKVLCGYSDITALSNAIYKKTGLVTYSGPHFSTFGMKKGIEYTVEYFEKCVMKERPLAVEHSDTWSDDAWYIDQENRTFIKNEGPLVIQEGECEGTILGGNLCTLNLLQGTEYMPILKNAILFLEDDYAVCPRTFDRDLQSLLHMPDADGIKGIVIGRFQKASQISDELLTKIIKTKREIAHIPVVANLNFGHTTPSFTFPIGGRAKLLAVKGQTKLTITEH